MAAAPDTVVVGAVVVDAVPIGTMPTAVATAVATPAHPALFEIAALLKRELGLESALNLKETLTAAAEQLGVPHPEGTPMAELADRCWRVLGAPPVASAHGALAEAV